jgi:lipopolysaccharide export system permease protein
VNDDGTLSNVFVQRRSGDKVIVVVAEKAGQRNDEELGLKVLTFQNGERYEGVPGDPEFLVMKFAEHGIPFAVRESRPGDVSEEAQTLNELLDQLDPAAVAEIQWRISVPITLLVLTLIAVPLSRAAPRTGRYNNLIAGILLYIIYANLLGASKVWLEQERVPAWVGLWWVHLLFIAFAVVLLMRQNNVFLRFWQKYKGGASVANS